MPYFNRLTDIVTCSLTGLLEAADDPQTALEEIIREMQEGVAGAERSSQTAARNAARIGSEIDEQHQQVASWVETARQHVAAGEDDRARQALLRKREVEDLIAALQEQQRAAEATQLHLKTTLHALQARLADARRRLAGFRGESKDTQIDIVSPSDGASSGDSRLAEVEAELSQLRDSLGNSG